MTNFEYIKEMTIEEMAVFIANIQVNEIRKMCPLPDKFNTVENIAKFQLKWLNSEVSR